MSGAHELVLLRHDPCPWLPAGGTAEVVACEEAAALGPTPVVRLLVTAEDAVLAVPRPDDRGLDLPTARVRDGVLATRDRLHDEVLGAGGAAPRLVGFVRNTVPGAPADYPWPLPVACFAVWHVEAARDAVRTGRWLDPAEDALGERHWWPLLAGVFALREPTARPAAPYPDRA